MIKIVPGMGKSLSIEDMGIQYVQMYPLKREMVHIRKIRYESGQMLPVFDFALDA